MKKAYRVKNKEQFQLILNKGNSFANRELVIYYKKNPSYEHFRVGISVGKKIGNAVKRNKIKRLIREAVRKLKDHIDPEVDIIIIARHPTLNMSLSQIERSLIHLLHREKLYRR